MKFWKGAVALVVVMVMLLASRIQIRADGGFPPGFIPIITSGGVTGVLVPTPDTGLVDIYFNSQSGSGLTVTGGGSGGGSAATGVVYGTYPDTKSPIIHGFYQAPNGKYYAIQAPPPNNNGDTGGKEPSGCPCGGGSWVDGEKVCPACSPPTCTSITTQYTQTGATSGPFGLQMNGVSTPSKYGVTTYFQVWTDANGQDDYRAYTGINQGGGIFNYGLPLENHPGYGKIWVYGYVQEFPYGQITTCPHTSFDRVRYVAGTVFYDPTNTCSTAEPWTKTTDLRVSYNDLGADYSTSLVKPGETYAGSYALSFMPPGPVSLQLTNIPSNYSCSTCNPAGCPNIPAVATPSYGNNFFLTDQFSRAAWWQVEGAGVYAGGGGTSVKSTLPDSSTRLILAATGGTAAAAFTPGGSADTGAGSISDPGYIAKSQYKGRKMNYGYFSANMGVLATQTSDWNSDTMSLVSYPTGRDFGYMKPVSGTATVVDPITVGVGEKDVIFVNGDLRINNNIIVANGGFLAFIVSGKISVDPSVTTLQGIYLSNGNFVTDSVYVKDVTSDVALDVQGSVITWGTMDLKRDLGTGNTTAPGEKFTYRPDLLTNMPDKMKSFAMNWQEVAPGTFGN